MAKRKGGSGSNGLTDFKKVCVMWGVKFFFPPIGKVEDEEAMAAHEKHLQHRSQLSIEKQDKLVSCKKIVRPNILETEEAISDRLHENFYHPGITTYTVLRTIGK